MIDTNVMQELWAEIRDAILEEAHDHHYDINQSDGLPASYLLLKEALFKYYGDGYEDGSFIDEPRNMSVKQRTAVEEIAKQKPCVMTKILEDGMAVLIGTKKS